MSIPVFQQSCQAGNSSGSFSAATFSSNNGAGNCIIVAVVVQATSGTVTAISLSDNNGNMYTALTTLAGGGKTPVYRQTFVASGISVSPNTQIAITPSATFGTGALSKFFVLAAEWNNCNTTNAIYASTQANSIGPATLTSQPANTTAVGISLQANDSNNHGTSGPPTWAYQASGGEGSGVSASIFDSENFAAGTVVYHDGGTGTSPAQVVLAVLAERTPAPPVVPYSVPDCRNYATFPNNSVSVNGTLTYTVNAQPSHSAPVDSRAAGAPVASGTYPQNSRTPGTFGPGE
jgi:hypothetical protein